MAKTKISALTTLADGSIANGDLIPIVDIDDYSQAASGTTKKVTITSLASAVATAFSGDSPTFVNLTTTGTTTLGDSGDATTVNGTLAVGAITSSGALALGTNTITSGLINGQTISSVANFTGTLGVTGVITAVGNTTGGIKINDASGNQGATIHFLGSSTTPNWQVGNQVQSSNAFTVTPSTTNGGTTFTTPALTIIGTTSAAQFAGTLGVTGVATFSSNIVMGVYSIVPTGTLNYLVGDASNSWAMGYNTSFVFGNNNGTLNVSTVYNPANVTTWNTTSDERTKTEITNADLVKCYDLVKNVQLKYYALKDEYFPEIQDKHRLGWLAQDVETYLPKAINISELKDLSDCKSINADQIYTAMYGAVQMLIQKVEALESKNV